MALHCTCSCRAHRLLAWQDVMEHSPYFTTAITIIQVLSFAFVLYVILSAKGKKLSSMKVGRAEVTNQR